MWERMLNKKYYSITLGVFLILVCLNQFAFAFPEYTSREKALKLAEVLDHGYFRSIKISSVFVKNRGKDDYFLQAILDDGSSRKWLLNRIREWTQSDELILSDNSVLVFPSPESTDFGVLKKNDFYRSVLNATAFVKIYGMHDIIEDKRLVLGVKRFRILEPKDSKFLTTDKLGERYRYVLELENGTREFLTYNDAFALLQRSAFLEEVPENVKVLRKTFKVIELKKLPLQLEDELRDIWRFGIEVVFDGPIEATPDLFRYQVVESKLKDPETGIYKAQFFMQIVFPNSEKVSQISGFKNHEYLRFVELDTDVEHQKRVILRAMVNPDALNLPPFIEITGRNSIIVNFYSSTDQSIIEPPNLLASRSVEDLPRSVFTTEKQEETEFEKNYMEAVKMIRKAQTQLNTDDRIETYFKALKSLKHAALSSEKDIQIAQALKQRDILLRTMPKLIIRNVQMLILALDLESINVEADPKVRNKLLKQLIHAERYATTQEQQRKISTLRSILRSASNSVSSGSMVLDSLNGDEDIEESTHGELEELDEDIEESALGEFEELDEDL